MSQAKDFTAWTIEEFRANNGRVGGPFAGAPLVLLHTASWQSGIARTNPMMYLSAGDRYLVFAAKSGSPRNPDWYHNLKAHPDAEIEVGDRTIRVRATELTGAEPDCLGLSAGMIMLGSAW